jgi:HD-like signal output (HDOD) protein/CheY-like chemotaxis protein
MNLVLFVDDEPRVLAGLRRMLRSRQGTWDMRFVEGGADALDLMIREPVDVVVSDFRMPGLDGGEFLAEVRRWRPQTARLILSGHTAEKDLMRVATIAHQFLTKPCDADHLVSAVEGALRLRHEIPGERLRSELTAVTALPSSPGALQQLVEILQLPGSDARTVAAVIQQDIGLTAKVLQLVNSSFFALRSRTTSLETAVTRLGIQTLRSLLLRDDLVRAFEIPEGVPADWVALLNTHALETALLARRLAAPEARNDAFCGALLLECGQLAFAVCRPAVFSAHQKFREQAPALADIEARTFGVSHAQAGAYLLSLWGFPDEIVQAVAHPATAVAPDTPGRLSAASAIQLARQLVESESMALCRAPGVPTMPDGALASAGVLDEVKAWRARRSPAGKEQVA